MAEEWKMNEFENEADPRMYHTHKNLQQAYGPEANFHYRANSAEEILNDMDKLQRMIQDHYQNQCPRLAALDNYIKARNEGIYDDGNRRSEKGKADHRAAHNFAKVINVFDVGYNTGVPIKKSSDNDEINQMIREYDAVNDIEELDSELWRDFRKYGRAYELQYRNQKDEDRSVISNVFETFVCYGQDVGRTPLFAVRYPRYWDGIQELVTVQAYTDTEIITYKSCSMATLSLVEEERTPHFWGEVPITEYSPDRYRQGGYEDVASLIDLYDAAQSDTANYMTDFNEATLLITGDLDMGRYSVAEIIAMKQANLLLLKNGVNPDGSASQTDARYVYKQYDVNGTEAYKERLQKDIHKISFVPDLSDESFAGTQSGEAMKYKLFGFQQMSKSSQRGFKKGLKRRYRLLLNIKNYVQEADNTDLGDFTITFTPNLPKAVLEELKALAEAGAEFSQGTLLELASFVEDAQKEIEKVKEERRKEQESVIDQRMFGGGMNGQPGILEAAGRGEPHQEPEDGSRVSEGTIQLL